MGVSAHGERRLAREKTLLTSFSPSPTYYRHQSAVRRKRETLRVHTMSMTSRTVKSVSAQRTYSSSELTGGFDHKHPCPRLLRNRTSHKCLAHSRRPKQ